MTTTICPNCGHTLAPTFESRAAAVAARCGLTPRRKDLIQLILELSDGGCAPTLQELADKIGRSKPSVFEAVEACVKLGAIQKRGKCKRNLKVIES